MFTIKKVVFILHIAYNHVFREINHDSAACKERNYYNIPDDQLHVRVVFVPKTRLVQCKLLYSSVH